MSKHHSADRICDDLHLSVVFIYPVWLLFNQRSTSSVAWRSKQKTPPKAR